MKRLLATTLLAGSLVACGGGEGSETFSCYSPTAGLCFTETIRESLMAGAQPIFEVICGMNSATAIQECPSASRVGRCSGINGNETNRVPYVWSYYAPSYTAAQVQDLCALSGATFTAN